MNAAWSHRGRVDSSSSSSSSSSQASFYLPPVRSKPPSHIPKKGSLELDDDSGNVTSEDESDDDDDSSEDDDDYNRRVVGPCWEAHRRLLERRGFRLDTYRDVKLFYERYWANADDHRCSDSYSRGCRNCNVNDNHLRLPKPDVGLAAGYIRACRGGREGREGEDGLCRDAGLPENLFRGTRVKDGTPIVVKAVHLRSRELSINRILSSPPLKHDPANHTVPVCDLIEVPEHGLAFIVQEEWSPEVIIPGCTTCTLRDFLRGIRACIEGLVFMHTHHIAHLDISLRNLLSDNKGRFFYIDFEMSRYFPPSPPPPFRSKHHVAHVCDAPRPPRVGKIRATEVPPELELGGESDPFKVDIFQLGMLIVNANKLTGYETLLPEIAQVVRPMLHPSFECRPGASAVLQTFDKMAQRISEQRLKMYANQ